MKIYCLDSSYKNTNVTYLCESDLTNIKSFEDSFFIFKNINDFILSFISKNNLKKYINYIESRFLKKKVVLFYGNCHLNPIQEMLNKTKAFADNYFIWPLLGICQIKDSSYFNHPVFNTFCNIFVDQEIQKNNSYGEEFSSEFVLNNFVNPKAKRIVVPNTYKLPLFIFPQCDNSFYYCDRDTHLFFKDKILEEHYSCYKRPMKSKDYFNKLKEMSNEFEGDKIKFLDKVKSREKKWDIKISEFLDLHLAEGLYCDPHHPSFTYLYFLYKELCSLLKIAPENFIKNDVVNLNPTEMPSIFDIGNYKKKYRDTGNSVPLKLSNYIKLYGIAKSKYDRNSDISSSFFYKLCKLKCRVDRKIKRMFNHS